MSKDKTGVPVTEDETGAQTADNAPTGDDLQRKLAEAVQREAALRNALAGVARALVDLAAQIGRVTG